MDEARLRKIYVALLVLFMLIFANILAVLALAGKSFTISSDANATADRVERISKQTTVLVKQNRKASCDAYPARQKELIYMLDILQLTPERTRLENLYRDETLPGLMQRARNLDCPLPQKPR